jgi:hypothetical protein
MRAHSIEAGCRRSGFSRDKPEARRTTPEAMVMRASSTATTLMRAPPTEAAVTPGNVQGMTSGTLARRHARPHLASTPAGRGRSGGEHHMSATGQGSAGNVIAAICSLIFPGLGQLVQGRVLSALGWFLAACIAGAVSWVVTLSLAPFGWLLVSVFACIDAASYRRD